jgi:hypothetical protein
MLPAGPPRSLHPFSSPWSGALPAVEATAPFTPARWGSARLAGASGPCTATTRVGEPPRPIPVLQPAKPARRLVVKRGRRGRLCLVAARSTVRRCCSTHQLPSLSGIAPARRAYVSQCASTSFLSSLSILRPHPGAGMRFSCALEASCPSQVPSAFAESDPMLGRRARRT